MCAACPCTGNQGFYEARTKKAPDGSIIEDGYRVDRNFGDSCNEIAAWDPVWADNPHVSGKSFCYIPCNQSICPGIPRHETKILWEATDAGHEICYSYEACGSVDTFSVWVASCEEKGAHVDFRAGKCVETVVRSAHSNSSIYSASHRAECNLSKGLHSLKTILHGVILVCMTLS